MIGSADRIDELEPDENPVDVFPCMNSQGVHAEARAQLYTLVMHSFLDAAMELEPIIKPLTEDGPYIHELDPRLLEELASKDENDIEDLVVLWLECEPIEELGLDQEDLNEFLFQLVHFCQTAKQEEELSVYIYSDG